MKSSRLPHLWSGVDHINTDDLAGLAEFLRAGPGRAAPDHLTRS